MNAYEEMLRILSNQWEQNIVLKRNEFLIRAGQTEKNIYLVSSGSLRIFIEDEKEEHTIRFGYTNSIITALDSFLSRKPTIYQIQGIKKTELKSMSINRYNQIINSNESYKRVWNELLKGFVNQMMERELDLLTYSPQKRFQRLMERSPQVFQEIPLKYIASYLRMTPETLSRVLKNHD